MKELEQAFKRHFTAIALFLVMLLAIGASKTATLQTAATIIAMEMIALWLCYVVLYVFTPINYLNFITEYFNAKNLEYNVHQSDKAAIACWIVVGVTLAVHALVGLCVFGIYFTASSPIPSITQ